VYKSPFMNRLFFLSAAILVVTGSIAAIYTNNRKFKQKPTRDEHMEIKYVSNVQPKIQVAVLLDVSNSMDGLIEQAKAQLWNMVSVLGKATCNDLNPTVEIALYEYGRPTNDAKAGYVKQINAFTNDLDQVSQNLFKLTTNGGDEFCGHVIYTSLTNLNWDTTSANYKVIFIAGNEDFLQGDITYTRACTEAKKKGVIVNTIYCGDRMQGIQEHWNLGSECGQGSFTIINQDAKMDDIATPYDSTLFTLNEQLNGTYIAYGSSGLVNMEKQQQMDKLNYSLNKSAAAKRVEVKSKKSLYKNSTWDLVDAAADDKTVIDKIDVKTLPDSLRSKSKAELTQLVKTKSNERTQLQKDIAALSVKRDNYIAAEKAKGAKSSNAPTLESEVEKIIKQQAKRFNMVIQ
jgi:hypothetical protein